MATAVLRGLSPTPFAFAAFDGTPAAAARWPEPEPALSPDDAFEAGRQQALAEAAEQTAALEAEAARLAAALDQAERDRAAHADALHQSAERLAGLWADGVWALEPALAALAVETAEAVLEAPLSGDQRAAAARALSGAIDHVAGGPPVTVSLHPVDLLAVQESGLAGALDETHPGLRWEADAGLAEGDWAVSTADAAIRRVRTAMVAALRERLGLPASP